MDAREELQALRRLAELEAKASGKPAPQNWVEENMAGGPEWITASYAANKETKDPASFAGYEIGGKVTDWTGSPMAGYAANVATQALPVVLGGEVAKLTKPLFEKGAKSLMQSALKPTLKQLETGEAQTAVNTLLKEGINPTEGGVAVLRSKSKEVGQQLADALRNSTATVKVGDVGKPLTDTLTAATRQVNPGDDVEVIKNAWNQFRNLHPLVGGKQDIPVQLAQQLKTGTYKQLSDKYGELGSASVEAQKALARGLKDEISAAVPGVSALNARQSELLQTLDVAERRALMELNKNPAGLALIAPTKSQLVAFLADKSALFKSLLARIMYSGSETIPANVARGGIGAYQAAQELEAQEQ